MLAIDAKLAIDENALYRQPTLAAYEDPTQLPMQEARAKEFDLAYVAMEGNIGCMVNGAGLAMATMDIIQHYGAKPANFLDVGGGASQEKVAEGLKSSSRTQQSKPLRQCLRRHHELASRCRRGAAAAAVRSSNSHGRHRTPRKHADKGIDGSRPQHLPPKASMKPLKKP